MEVFMEGFSIGSLINKNYDKVLDIISKPFKTDKEVKKQRNKVYSLTFDSILGDDNVKNKMLEAFDFLWDVMPKEIFDVYTIEKLNQRIAQFSKYVVSVESSYEDHGFTLLVSYYIMACDKFLALNKK
jgi:hypothetical protein